MEFVGDLNDHPIALVVVNCEDAIFERAVFEPPSGERPPSTNLLLGIILELAFNLFNAIIKKILVL